MKIESIQDVNKDADLYLESLTDNYFENTSKRILVKNAYIMGMFAHVKDRDFLLNEICRLKKLNLENLIELKEAQKSRIQMFENYSGYGDDYIGDADRIQKEIDELRKELDSINEIKPDVKGVEGLQKIG